MKDNGLIQVLVNCENHARKCKTSTDVQYNSSSEIRYVSRCELPYYDATSTYKRNETGGFVFSEIGVSPQTPPKNVNVTAISKNRTADRGKKSTWRGYFTIVVIVAIAFVITIYSSYRNYLHSPKQMKIEVVGMETEYDPEASPYINGCYYIHLDYEIQAKKLGIEYIDLKVHVSEKGGEELGVIRSSLSYIDLEAHDEKVITTSWSENQPEKNDFFSELYDKDFSELEFEFEIGSIQFDDGKYYHNDDYDRFG